MITEEEFAALRARLEAKHDELVFALRALAASGIDPREDAGGPSDHFFRLLGIVSFWLALEERPSRERAAEIDHALKMLKVVKVKRA